MNPEIKDAWITALRSGEFQQGTGALHVGSHGSVPEQFCCLGVLCELATRAGVVGSPQLQADGRYSYGPLLHAAYLPPEIAAWAGLDDNALPRNPKLRDTTTLSQHNDAGKTFEQIADIIEEQL